MDAKLKTYDEKVKIYKKNFTLFLKEIVDHIRANIRNNKHNSEYNISILRKAVMQEMKFRTNSTVFVDQIINYKPGIIHIEEISRASCKRYGELMLQKHPHLGISRTMSKPIQRKMKV